MAKTVFITGASSGIGKASARRFAAKGWNVAATMRDPAAGADLAGLDNVLVGPLDVRDPHSIAASLAAAIARFGRIDALINNAGFSLYGVFESLPREKIREQFEVNVFGLMDMTRAVLPHFRKNRAGMIVNISSRAGLVGMPMISLYCASKFALEGFSEALALELASQNITVKIVEPSGGVASTNFLARMSTEQSADSTLSDYDAFVARMQAAGAGRPAGPKTSAEDVADVVFAAVTDGSDRLRYFTGNDTGDFVKAKREMPDQAYVDFMRSRFPLKG
jgi:NAD(P)-dependent dehydrogenase (short-subunit alcohol dehydrogenase family)